MLFLRLENYRKSVRDNNIHVKLYQDFIYYMQLSFVAIAKEHQHNLSLSLLSGASQFDFKKQQELQYVKLHFAYRTNDLYLLLLGRGASFAVNKFFNKANNLWSLILEISILITSWGV